MQAEGLGARTCSQQNTVLPLGRGAGRCSASEEETASANFIQQQENTAHNLRYSMAAMVRRTASTRASQPDSGGQNQPHRVSTVRSRDNTFNTEGGVGRVPGCLEMVAPGKSPAM